MCGCEKRPSSLVRCHRKGSPDYFRLANVFVMSSVAEGFGIVFLEVMATGIRVIGGNQDGSADPLADGELGWAVDPDNEQELLSAICANLSTDFTNVDRASRFNHQAFAEHLRALVTSSFIAGH
jgi:phosphatidylinositol alpha-1,6-mannosyltransferase